MPLDPNDLLTESAEIRLAGDNVIGCETDGASVLLGDTATVIIADPRDGRDVSVGISKRSAAGGAARNPLDNFDG